MSTPYMRPKGMTRVPLRMKPPRWIVRNRGNLILCCVLAACVLVWAGR